MPHSYCKSIGAGGWMERVSYDCQERPPSSLTQYQKAYKRMGVSTIEALLKILKNHFVEG